ncbi:MAG: M15 family metallopeptidase [Lachnospiraceae bacterium]|jgi:D-alanyl-D-alanine dipeptidase/carboxypeptidase|nr:M15 family metallopeptidase [Lachnospiraceae bacterium]
MKRRRRSGWSRIVGVSAQSLPSVEPFIQKQSLAGTACGERTEETKECVETLWLPRERTARGPLILVNRQRPLWEGWETDLVSWEGAWEPLSHGTRRPFLLERETARMLQFVLCSLSLTGEIKLVSGYRQRQEQQQLYASSLVEHGEVFTRSYVAIPGCSEHETGLAVDLGEAGEETDYIRPSFPYEGNCQRFRQKAVSCGFVERYQKEKRGYTHIQAEPWHFRYVGIPHARIMEEQDLCLEEYLEFLKGFPEGEEPFLWQEECWEFRISYQRAEEGETPIQVPANQLYRISGDNQGGFIKTVWRRI